MAQKKSSKIIKEPNLVIRPLGRFGGLDGLHFILIVLLVVSLALLLYISYARQSIVILTNQTQNNTICQYGYANNSCIEPLHNTSEILFSLEKYLAGYSTYKGSESLLPFISNISRAKEYYMPSSRSWFVSIPERYINSNTTFNFSAVVSDLNISIITPLIQTIKSNNITNNFVAGNGYIKIADTVSCINSTTTPINWFIDPYSTGSISSLSYLQNITNKFASNITPNIDILYTQSSQEIANTYGLSNATLLGKYLFCSSQQSSFNTFVTTLNSSYKNIYLDNSFLSQLAKNSGLNMTTLNSCIVSSGTIINRQAILAKHYNITISPSVLIGCQYLAIPQTAYESICSINNKSC